MHPPHQDVPRWIFLGSVRRRVQVKQFYPPPPRRALSCLLPIVSRIQLFEGTKTNTSSSHILQWPEEKKIESVARFFVDGLRQRSLTIGDVSQRKYCTPTDHENGSAVYTHDDSDISAPSNVSSFNFTLSILNLLMPYIGINKESSIIIIIFTSVQTVRRGEGVWVERTFNVDK